MNGRQPPSSPVLVTGANGFIGSALCQLLSSLGCQVRGLVLKGTDPGILPGLGVQVCAADIRDPGSLAESLRGVQTVFHLAALAKDWGRRADFLAANTEGTRNVLAAAAQAGARRLVHMSTLAVHRFRGYVEADESVPADSMTFGYGASKVLAEGLVRQAHRAGALETTIIRPGAVIFGPRDTTAFIHLGPVLEKGKMPLVRGGRVLTCYSYVENLVEGMVLAAARPEGAGETFILTDDLRITLRELLAAVCRELGAPADFRSIPSWAALSGAWVVDSLWRLFGARNAPIIHRYRVGLVARDFHFTCQKAKRLLGYQPAVPLQEGLRRMVAWYREYRQSGGHR